FGERGALEDESERSGPEALRQRARGFGHVARPGERALGAVEMHDHRMIARPALHRIKTRHRLCIRSVGAEAVNGFGRKCNEAAVLEKLDGFANLRAHRPISRARLVANAEDVDALPACLPTAFESTAARPRMNMPGRCARILLGL